jgi:hypothetical protein
VIQEINQARGKGIGITIQWTPSHKRIPGNEEVDMLAKQAAGWDPQRKTVRSDFRASPYQIYTLRSVKKREGRRKTRHAWEERWRSHAHGRLYFPHAPVPHKTYLAAHGSQRKALSSMIIQMKTCKIGLYSYLDGIKPDKYPTDRCRGCDTKRETLQHVLLECHAYRARRQEYWPEGDPHSLPTPEDTH